MKKGDIVETIDDAIRGAVTKVSGTTITIEDTNGFEFHFEKNELMVVSSNQKLDNAIYDADIECMH